MSEAPTDEITRLRDRRASDLNQIRGLKEQRRALWDALDALVHAASNDIDLAAAVNQAVKTLEGTRSES